MDFEIINSLGFATVVAIIVLCFLVGLFVKNNRQIDDKHIPEICGVSGLVLGIVGLLIHMPDFPATDYITAAAVGVASGLAATGAHQVVKQRSPEPVNENIDYKEGYMNLLDERRPLLEELERLERQVGELLDRDDANAETDDCGYGFVDDTESGEDDGKGN